MKTPSSRGRTGRRSAGSGRVRSRADETDRLREAARFAAAPLAAITARATLTAALEAYLGRRSAARVLAGPLRRGVGETIEAALLFADLRGFTALSESSPPTAVISALDAWFDRIAGSVHAFGGEVLKFMGDGVLAIFPVVGGSPGNACDAALKAVAAARSGMAHLDEARRPGGAHAPALWRGAASRRDAVGQYRRRRPARFHGDWPRRQSGQPPRGSLPAARPGRPCLGRLRRRDDGAAGCARNACFARHRLAVRGVHRGRLAPQGALTARRPASPWRPAHRGPSRRRPSFGCIRTIRLCRSSSGSLVPWMRNKVSFLS